MTNFPDANSSNESIQDHQSERFPDLRTAGIRLAPCLESYRHGDRVVVLTPALGGVPVAYAIAEEFNQPLDFILRRRLLTPDGPGSDVSALTIAGQLLIDEHAPPIPDSPSSPLEYFLADAIAGLKARTALCRGAHPTRDLAGKTILLVDCGVHTGGTIHAALRALRRTNPGKIVLATPVISRGALTTLNSMVDEIVYLLAPKTFGNTALWFEDFSRPSEEEISSLLRP